MASKAIVLYKAIEPPKPWNETGKFKKEITILLLGETGVGKSTFINAFVNYLAHEKLEDAAKDIACLIPSYFTVIDQQTYEMKKVSLGKFDRNEDHTTGKSATQLCKCYVFSIGDTTIKLIDTPGIGDTRGVETDGTNMRNLLSFIAQYKEINAICVLLKPNNARVDVVFKYCILQLLTHLNKSASRNIIFLFTNARSTFYAPGDSAPSLLEILKAVREKPPNVDIKFNKDNIYCLDNEAFRFLVATSKPNNIKFNDAMRRDFETSWEKSIIECDRLMRYILTLPPHQVQDTISVNNARTSILLLTQPLGDIAKNIADNMKACEVQERKLFEWEGDIEDLQKELYTPSVDIISTSLERPKTVCGDPNCCDKKYLNGSLKIHYRTTCHDPCYLDYSDGNIIGNTGLLECKAFNKYESAGEWRWYKDGEITWHPDHDLTPNENGEIWGQLQTRVKSEICLNCNHSYQVHLHIDYETHIKHRQMRDENKYKRITNTKDAVAAQQEKIKELKDRIAQLKNERDEITKCTAKFACFLRNNALTPFNDAFEDYLQHLIINEKSGISLGTDNQQTVDNLNRMIEAYKQEKSILENAMNKGVSKVMEDISSESIEVYIGQLCNLKLYGQTIKNHLEMQKKSQEFTHSQYKEVKCDVKNSKNSWWNKIPFFGNH